MSKITKEAIHHIVKSNYSYGYDCDTLHLRIKTKKGEVKKASLRIGDPYIWAVGGCDGGNMNATGGGWIGGETYSMKKEGESTYFDHWIAEYRPLSKRSRYAFILEGEEEKILFSEKKIEILKGDGDEEKLCAIGNFFCFPYLNSIDVAKTPTWVKDTVWYQIFPDRFCNGDKSIDPKGVEPWGTEPTKDNFMGGDLKGVLDKLDYLCDLGINGLYFCPIFEASENHRYETIDYFKVDKALGGNETFKLLVKEAHKRGMKIMLDAVFNHVGYLSPMWQDVLKNKEKSRYKDWFCIREFPIFKNGVEDLTWENLNYETFGRIATMPKLNTENNEVSDYLLKVAKFWVEEMEIDAWRLDVANEVDHVFWRKFRETIKNYNKEVYILGEVWHDALPWLMGDQFDAVMNYPLTEAIKDYFCLNNCSKEEFKYRVEENKFSYLRQIGESIFNLLDSHDTPRILTVAKGNKSKMKLSYVFMFTQAGSPCIYYGDEIAMEGNQGMGMELHRRCMIWDEEKQDKEMLKFMKKIIKIRKENKAFNLLDNNWINNSDKEVLIYSKENIFVIINNSEKEKYIKLPRELKNKGVLDLYSENIEDLGEEIFLENYSFKIYKIL